MAWNGGVSLAIWMGGVAVELDTARRAHLGPQNDDGDERSLYHALASAFERELVIDILAGASAGGINGALLGAVITKGRELRPKFLRDRWLEIGDLSALLRPINDASPSSLMRGDYFQEEIEAIFRAVTGEETAEKEWLKQTKPSDSRLEAGEVLLDIQATNVIGTERGFSDEWGQTLYAREYRAPIKFRTPDHYSSDALAAAARASASFPAAFEPSPLMGKTAALAGFPTLKRWAIDGGLLENAPIRPAIDLIPTRHAERPVTRFVCYVNAAPTIQKKDKDDPQQPDLRQVLSDVVNLPREARFIDQLIAIEDAQQRPTGVKEAANGLLGLPTAPLRATAEALFDAYRKPRTTASLREILSASSDGGLTAAMVDKTAERLGAKQLPWMPDSLTPPTAAAEWRWGLRPAQRILLLQLDLLRMAAEHDDPVQRAKLMNELLPFRRPLNKALARLEDARARFASSPAIRAAALRLAEAAGEEGPAFDEQLGELDSLMVGFRCEAFDAVERSTRTLHEALVGRDNLPAGIRMTELFGDAAAEPFIDTHLKAFLQRALAIEVVRRSFAPDHELEPAQDLHFVQLTPLAPVQVFAKSPLSDEGPKSGKEKLTGLELAHFSAFYRGSWRVNDFMWGRLDAATRIVELLVSPTRAGVVGLDETSARLKELANVLVPVGDDTRAKELRFLAIEAFTDAQRALPCVVDGVRIAAQETTPEEEDVPSLRKLMTQALAADLADPRRGGFFTRVVCARAAQYEILQQEVRPLADATARDGKLGCFTKPIHYDPNRGILEQARNFVANPVLPKRLGSGDPDETTSTLAVRTVAHAVLVLLSSLKTAGVPFGRTLGIVRAPFLSLAGITAEKMRYRATALLAFVAGSFYITARATEAENGPAELKAAWSPSTLATLVAVFAVLALVVLPVWRAVQAEDGTRKVKQGLWGTAMFLASGLAALIAGFFAVGFGNALTSTGGFTISDGLAAAVIAVPLGATWVIRHVPLPSFGQRRLTKLTSRIGFTALVTVGVAGKLIYESSSPLRGTIGIWDSLTGWLDGDNWGALGGVLDSPSELWEAIKRNWREGAVIATYASVPLAGLYGLHGFVRTAVDLARVRGPTLWRRPVNWALKKIGRPAADASA